ncbi:unnamed protein product [Symbiodinium microadriaticum]|nr:unnamed protein product [Symbiodinium microadriaticum]
MKSIRQGRKCARMTIRVSPPAVEPGECSEEALPGFTVLQDALTDLWEPVGGSGNHACRGDNASDNDPRHYVVHKIYSLEECKLKCMGLDRGDCRGIEYSHGRCEIWTRAFGIFAYAEIPLEKAVFTCLRYGWPTSKLSPAEPSTSHPCRYSSPEDDDPTHYDLLPSKHPSLEECKAACTGYRSGNSCTGIEWSPGRCEVWTSPIGSFDPTVTGFTCMKMGADASRKEWSPPW